MNGKDIINCKVHAQLLKQEKIYSFPLNKTVKICLEREYLPYFNFT